MANYKKKSQNYWMKHKPAPPYVDYNEVKKNKEIVDYLYPYDWRTDEVLCYEVGKMPKDKQVEANFRLALNKKIRSAV